MVVVSAIYLLFCLPEEILQYDIATFNLNCPRDGRELEYSKSVMHGFTQLLLIVGLWNV